MLEPLAFPSLRVVFTTETIPQHRKHECVRPNDLSVVCCERAGKQARATARARRVGTKEKQREGDRKRNNARSVLAKARGGRNLHARLNFGTLAFSDQSLSTMCSLHYKSNSMFTAQECTDGVVIADARHTMRPLCAWASHLILILCAKPELFPYANDIQRNILIKLI